jgi:hypothetical protein
MASTGTALLVPVVVVAAVVVVHNIIRTPVPLNNFDNVRENVLLCIFISICYITPNIKF